MSYHFKRRSTRLPSMSLVDACMALQECFGRGEGKMKECVSFPLFGCTGEKKIDEVG